MNKHNSQYGPLGGRDLRVGDVVDVWWKPGRDTIISLREYSGPLAYLWDKDGGAQIARFAQLNAEMTIEPLAAFHVFNRPCVGRFNCNTQAEEQS